jgi:hypothetical protein
MQQTEHALHWQYLQCCTTRAGMLLKLILTTSNLVAVDACAATCEADFKHNDSGGCAWMHTSGCTYTQQHAGSADTKHRSCT